MIDETGLMLHWFNSRLPKGGSFSIGLGNQDSHDLKNECQLKKSILKEVHCCIIYLVIKIKYFLNYKKKKNAHF